MPERSFREALTEFAEELRRNFSSSIPADPEDQLKAPVCALLREAGAPGGHAVRTRTETRVAGLGGQPDIGVEVDRLLSGHVELKAPGKGANPARFRGADQEQWRKFQALPNLVYTDGSEWSLFRSGERRGQSIRLAGDVTTDGRRAVTLEDAEALRRLIADFLLWRPVVPTTPRALAELLAPLCRLVRDDVSAALKRPDSSVSALAAEWRVALFPDADDAQFADAYAQTVTYALLLARLEGQGDVRPTLAADALDAGHGLLAQALRILSQREAREEIGVGLDLLVRVINEVEPDALRRRGNDPWLYFYEDFLAAYDPKLRNDRGVYYTPPEVIKAQTRLVSEILHRGFQKQLGYADPHVTCLDPAAGTGAYPLSILQHGLDEVERAYGPGSRSACATQMASNVHAFEILVGPYAVAHLRVTQKIRDEGGELPGDGVHVYLTDTLEAPHVQPPDGQMTLMNRRLGEEHRRAQKVKRETRILVCIGNPPYNRQVIDAASTGVEKRKGGWVRFGDAEAGGILEDFIRPARDAGHGVHLKNLYNDYVYFWRWALWKVFESTNEAGIVCLITAASYLRGPAFVGMREAMRRTFDDLWIIDLEGDSLGARKTENVFAIRTPVAIALGVRYGAPNAETPAHVRYTRLTGTREEKLARLEAIQTAADVEWQECLSGWLDPLLPVSEGNYFEWPLLTDLFPWQYSGVQFKRTWPIGEMSELLASRWRALVAAPSARKAALFREAGRKVGDAPQRLEADGTLSPLRNLRAGADAPPIVRYAFRSFDRQWAFKDPRLSDRIRPPLWHAHGANQVYLTSLLTEVLGLGPAATVCADVPDLHHFRGSFGGRHVIPLWRDSAGEQPNIAGGLLDLLSASYGTAVTAEDLFAYCYSILAAPEYVDRFSEELTIPGPRIPLTKDAATFTDATALGRRLIRLHTFGERFAEGRAARVPQGRARQTRPIPQTPDGYPERFGYDLPTETLHVGEGAFAPVAPQVWDFSVSGFEVLKSWLSYRMQGGAGRKSSPLDDIRPDTWTPEMARELLEVIWVLEATVALVPRLAQNLDRIMDGPLFAAPELPTPTDEERKAPAAPRARGGRLPLAADEEED